MKKAKILFFLIISAVAIVYCIWNKPMDEINTIMLDPGHGAEDMGCSYDDVNEKDINYDIALRLDALLREAGFKVLMTHDDSEYIDPHKRAETANSKGVDLYISIHQNAADIESADGIETWYSIKDPHSKRLADFVQKALIENTGADDRGIKLTKDLIVVRETNMPSVLIECGFLSNPDERKKLADENYRQLIAESIAQAVEEFTE